MMMKRYQKAAPAKALMSAFCALMLTSCSVGPDFLRPSTAIDTNPGAGFINAAIEQTNSNQSMNRWWERINDPLLNHYVEQLLKQNLQLVQASERMVQARGRVTTQAGAYYPSLGADVSAARDMATNPVTSDRTYSNRYSAELTSVWQIDLFGKISRSVEAADASYLASAYDHEALTHSLIAELLNLRVEIAVNKKLLELAEKSAKNRRDIYELVNRRYELGVQNTKPQDIFKAVESVTSVQADVHQYRRLLADALYRLDVLLGQKPGTTDPSNTDFSLLADPIDVPVCLPADLLDRRPDLRASELRVKAANADIGVAIADLYPSLNLTGVIGFSDNSLGSLFSPDQLVGTLLANLTTKLFQGGALRANIDIQESEAREFSAAYAEQVLNAIREVESNLKADLELNGELANAKRSVEALSEAEIILQNRYLRGIETLKDLLDAQRDLYRAEQLWLTAQQQKWNARTSLYLALGGDWLGESAYNGCAEGNQE